MTSPQTILVVDDEQRIVEILRDYLEANGFQVQTAGDGVDALEVIQQYPIDGILLDIMLPGASGYEVCRQIRQISSAPVLFLTALDAEAGKLRGIGLGDDYIVKNASSAEIVARLRMVLRRGKNEASVPATSSPPEKSLHFGRLVIDRTAHEVRVAGQPVALTPKEYDLLNTLADHPHRALTHSQLMNQNWEGYGEPSTLWGYIRRLRTKIEVDPDHPLYIQTVWGVGYRFEGDPD